jgi:hypothetical protein
MYDTPPAPDVVAEWQHCQFVRHAQDPRRWNSEKPHPRALRAASHLDSHGVACALRRKRGDDENRSRRTENKKAGAFEGAGVGSMRLFSPR